MSTQEKKTIGILGGMGPLATADLFQKIVLLTKADTDREHIRVYIDSNANIPDRTAAILSGGEDPVPEMASALRHLEACGADCIIMPCNTALYFLPRLQAMTEIPFLSILTAAAEACKAQFPGKTVGILATRGTLAANPLSCLAGYTAIREIERTNACEIAGKMGDRLCDGLKSLLEQYGLPFVAYNQGSIVHLECTGAMSFDFSSMSFAKSAVGLLKHKDMMYVRKDSMERMGAAYMANGIVTLAGSRLYTSMADTPEIIDEALNRFEEVFKHVKRTNKGLLA